MLVMGVSDLQEKKLWKTKMIYYMARKKAQVIVRTCFKLGAYLVHIHCLCFGRRVKGNLERDFISSYEEVSTIYGGYQEKPTTVNLFVVVSASFTQ